MAEITFHVGGNPMALKRHRMTKTGHTYDPSATDKADFLAKTMSMKPAEPLTKPIFLIVEFCFSRPKNHFTKKGLRPTAPRFRESRPDLDNLIKFVTDAMNGVFYRDDAQIVKIAASKLYSEFPGVWIKVTEITERT